MIASNELLSVLKTTLSMSVTVYLSIFRKSIIKDTDRVNNGAINLVRSLIFTLIDIHK